MTGKGGMVIPEVIYILQEKNIGNSIKCTLSCKTFLIKSASRMVPK